MKRTQNATVQTVSLCMRDPGTVTLIRTVVVSLMLAFLVKNKKMVEWHASLAFSCVNSVRVSTLSRGNCIGECNNESGKGLGEGISCSPCPSRSLDVSARVVWSVSLLREWSCWLDGRCDISLLLKGVLAIHNLHHYIDFICCMHHLFYINILLFN